MKKVFVIETDREDVINEISEDSLSIFLHARRKEGTFKVSDVTGKEIYSDGSILHDLVSAQ